MRQGTKSRVEAIALENSGLYTERAKRLRESSESPTDANEISDQSPSPKKVGSQAITHL